MSTLDNYTQQQDLGYSSVTWLMRRVGIDPKNLPWRWDGHKLTTHGGHVLGTQGDPEYTQVERRAGWRRHYEGRRRYLNWLRAVES